MTPNRTFETYRPDGPATFPSPDVIERHLRRSRQLRAAATAAMLASAGRARARPLRPLAARLAGWQRQRHTYDTLMRRSDRTLADIGIAREDIPLIAKGIDPHASEADTTVLSRWWNGMRVRRDAIRRARQERRRVYEELMAFDDRELDDLAIRRPDIPAIASGRMPAPAFE